MFYLSQLKTFLSREHLTQCHQRELQLSKFLNQFPCLLI